MLAIVISGSSIGAEQLLGRTHLRLAKGSTFSCSCRMAWRSYSLPCDEKKGGSAIVLMLFRVYVVTDMSSFQLVRLELEFDGTRSARPRKSRFTLTPSYLRQDQMSSFASYTDIKIFQRHSRDPTPLTLAHVLDQQCSFVEFSTSMFAMRTSSGRAATEFGLGYQASLHSFPRLSVLTYAAFTHALHY